MFSSRRAVNNQTNKTTHPEVLGELDVETAVEATERRLGVVFQGHRFVVVMIVMGRRVAPGALKISPCQSAFLSSAKLGAKAYLAGSASSAKNSLIQSAKLRSSLVGVTFIR